MDKETSYRKEPSNKIGCLPFLLGSVLGFVLTLLVSRRRVYKMGDYVVRGETKGRFVFANSMIGGLVGGFVVAAIAVIHRRLANRRKPKEEVAPEAPSKKP